MKGSPAVLSENEFNDLLNSLLPPNRRSLLNRLLLLLCAAVSVWLLLAGILLGLYALAAPQFHAASMTYGEALGWSGGVLLYVGVSLLLKETK